MTKRVFAPQASEIDFFVMENTQMKAEVSLKEERDYASNTECCVENFPHFQKQSKHVYAEPLESAQRSDYSMEKDIENLKSCLQAAHAAKFKAITQERLLKGILEETACECLSFPQRMCSFFYQ
jgi:hypothetical protein